MIITIYQILKEEGEPLSYSQIYASIIKQDPNHQGLFDEYIQSTLRNDLRFVKINKERWGLFEWLKETEQLCLNLLHAGSVKDFQFSLKQCFEFLGYKTEWFADHRQRLLVARAALDYKSYSFLVTGLPKDYNMNMIRAIDWPGIRKIKENMNIDSVILFSENFSVKELIERASEEGIQLYELSIFTDIIKEHQRLPFSLFELRIAFSPMHQPVNNIHKLMEIRSKQWEEWTLIREIIHILQMARVKNSYIDINSLIKGLSISGKSYDANTIDQGRVKKIIEQLSQEPFRLIELSESGNIILAYQDSLANKKINLLFQFIMNLRNYDIGDDGENN